RPRDRVAVWRPRHRDNKWYDWLECPATGAMAGRGDGHQFPGVLWQGGLLSRPWRFDSLHGHVGRALPTGPISDHGRAWSTRQRTRAQRVPAHTLREKTQLLPGAGRRSALPPGNCRHSTQGAGMIEKPADTTYAIEPLLQQRWSPRA